MPTDPNTLLNHSTLNFAQPLIVWQRQHGRHDLPWQNTHDAYRIWLSEIMLQQTQVATVKDYYARFLQHYPTVRDLAKADIDEVLSLWAGLGYYSRARNLHHCAQQVVAVFDGQFPSTPEQLMSLKGIGPSTAAAIAVFAYGYPAAILDGNVKRILMRYFAMEHAPSAATDKLLWEKANDVLASSSDAQAIDLDHATALRAYTQGLMDLGASLCSRTKPKCMLCPLNQGCLAQLQHKTHLIPVPKKATAIKTIAMDMMIYRHRDQLWLEKRPAKGIWASLYGFPETDQLEVDNPNLPRTSLNMISHKLTHRQLYIQPIVIDLNDNAARQLEERYAEHPMGVGVWVNQATAHTIGTPKPVSDLIQMLYSTHGLDRSTAS